MPVSCTLTTGIITAPAGAPCPDGSTLQYSTDGGTTWINTLPVYNQSGPAQTIQTRCNCLSDPLVSSPPSASITTVPGVCTPALFQVNGGGVRCATDNSGVAIGLSGSQTGVNYQLFLGTSPVGASVAGTGAPITVGNPMIAGSYRVVATNNASGCTASMSAGAVVISVNCNSSITDPCGCKNNATTLANGQFDETIQVNAPANQTWTVTALTGLYASGSPAPPAAPVLIPVGTVLTNLGNNTFTLNGIHVDALGYTISVSNGLGTTLSISNTCSYPNPVITSGLSQPFCLYSDAVPLAGNPGDANLLTQGFSVNGVPATTFDPGAGLGPYQIVYTVNGGNPKASGPADPGCIQQVSQQVDVVATPSSLVCNNLVNISLDENCGLELNADQILQGSYACYDDYIVEIDRTLPLGNGPWMPGILTAADIQHTYAVQVTHQGSGNHCWGNIFVEDKLPPVFENCGCVPTPISQFAGSIDNTDPVFLRPNAGTVCGNSFNTTFYDTYTFEVNTAGVYTFAQFADGGDGFGALYAGSFNPANPCQNFIAADDDGNVTPPASQGDDFLLTRTLTPGTYVLVVTAFSGNVAYGAYSVTVTGPTPVTAGDNCSFKCADKNGLLNGSIAAPVPTVTDNCGATTLIKTDVYQDNGACAEAFIFRTWTATDAWGNSSQCTQTLTLTPYTLDDVTLPDDITLECAGCGLNSTPLPCEIGIPTVQGNDADGIYELIQYDANCQVLSEGLCNLGAQYEDTRIDVCSGTFKILRHWTVLDWCTNTILEANQLIKIVDEQGPVITTPVDMTVSTNPSQCCATVNLPDVIVEDACSATANVSAMVVVYDQYLPDQVIGTYNIPNNTLGTFPGNNFWDCDTLAHYGTTPCLPIGIHQVMYMAEDVCGNTT
ncbi:MAG TPA: hypothetical protein PLM41_22525, partial [Saprospiraceae bacterium]|nr:hypothetical protein [Saprospiraceae bacterium]